MHLGEDWHPWAGPDQVTGTGDDTVFGHLDPDGAPDSFVGIKPPECTGHANCENAITINELRNHLHVLKPCVSTGSYP